LLHGGDLLILQHQIHQSAMKRKTAAALLGSAAVLVANSEWTRDRCLTVLGDLEVEVPADRVRVVPLGADPAFFRPGIDAGDVRRRYGLEAGRWMLSVARLVPYKGLDTGLRVLAQLAPIYPDLGYLAVGSGPQLTELRSMARLLQLEDRVKFLTGVPDGDLPALYNCAEVYLGLTRTTELDVEGFGISLVEASACGVPVVAARTGGIPDAVREGETGLLVDPSQAKPAATAVARLLDDRALARNLGSGGRRAVESYYNWDRVTSEMIAIGQELGSIGVSF